MDAQSDSKGKAGGRRDPFRRLERGGGAVGAFKEGTGSLFELRHVGMREGYAEILGHIWPEGIIFEDRPVPEDELTRLGWRWVEPAAGWERRWVLRSDLDRTDLRRSVHATLALLAPLHDQDVGSYTLMYRPPGDEDAGLAQVGCFFAAVSTVVGDVAGFILTALRNQHVPLLEMFLFAGTVGFLAGYPAFGTLFPRLLALKGAYRGRAAHTTTGLMAVVPGVIVAVVWLLAPLFGPVDGDLLLLIAGALIVAPLVVGFIAVAIVLLRPGPRARG
jgi:hypothetical protein